MSNYIVRKLAGSNQEGQAQEGQAQRRTSPKKDKPKKDNQDQESFEEAIEEMALTEQQVSHLIQQHVGDGFLELEDLIGDYAPEDITIVDLTGFTGTHTRYKQKSRSLVLSTALNSKAVK